MRREAAVGVLGACWLGAVAGGFWLWDRYDATAGPAASPTATTDARGSWTVVMFVHPHCPCARASLTELGELLREAPAGVEAAVVFVRPRGVPAGWERGDLWDAAGKLPVVVRLDEGGGEAKRAGAATSGHVVVFDRAGRPVFVGGITRARGRAGDNAGRKAVLAWLRGEAGVVEVAVFGCPLFDHCPEREDGTCAR